MEGRKGGTAAAAAADKQTHGAGAKDRVKNERQPETELEPKRSSSSSRNSSSRRKGVKVCDERVH